MTTVLAHSVFAEGRPRLYISHKADNVCTLDCMCDLIPSMTDLNFVYLFQWYCLDGLKWVRKKDGNNIPSVSISLSFALTLLPPLSSSSNYLFSFEVSKTICIEDKQAFLPTFDLCTLLLQESLLVYKVSSIILQ